MYEFNCCTIRIVTAEYKTAELKQEAIYPNELIYGSYPNYNWICGYGKVSNYKRLLSAKQQEDTYIQEL